MTKAGAALLAQMERDHLHLVQYQGRNYQGTILWAEGRVCWECTHPREPVVHDLIRAGAIVETRRNSYGGLETVTWYPTSALPLDKP